jgi:hypothetical protein
MNHHICPVHTAHRISNLPARKAHRSIWWSTDGRLRQPSGYSEVSHCRQDRRSIPVCC